MQYDILDYNKRYLINGKLRNYNFKINEIPSYIQVEMSTGEVTLYNTYDQMPGEVKQIFQELENNTK